MAKQVIPGNNALSIDEKGWVLFKRPHGTFYSSATQAIANTANTQVIALEKEVDKEGLIHDTVTNNSRIYVPTAGSYEIVFSGIADLSAAPANKHLHIWLAVDGTTVADSNTIVEIASASIEMTVAVSWINDLTAGQYVELVTWGDATTCEWLATAAVAAGGGLPARPAAPSVIVTVKKISSRLSYE